MAATVELSEVWRGADTKQDAVGEAVTQNAAANPPPWHLGHSTTATIEFTARSLFP